ncbi:MAG: hypothetical protein Q9191_004616 [Dirinaria sp. TL-2023a]
MSNFSLNAISGATADHSAMDVDGAGLAAILDQGWTDADFANPIYSQQDASMSSGFSCGSLTSGSLTPQSSTSASTSRRHSLVSSAPKSLSFLPPSATQSKRLTAQRTPVAYDTLYQGFGAPVEYLCSTPDPQSVEIPYPMEFEQSSASGKLQMALALGQPGSMEGGPYSMYNQDNLFTPQSGFESEESIAPAILLSQYSHYARDQRSHQAHPSLPAMGGTTTKQHLDAPQTVAPAQTTYTAPRTPSPTLAEPFVSPIKHSLARSPLKEGADFIGALDNFECLDNALESPGSMNSYGSEQSRTLSGTKFEENEEQTTISNSVPSQTFAASTDKKRASKHRICRRNHVGRRAPGYTVRKAQRHMPGPIRYEPEPQNICPYCEDRKAFKRPEHLNRHIKKHMPGEFEPCIIEECKKQICRDRKDNMWQHIKNTHLYPGVGPDGNEPKKGKKNLFLTIEEAKKRGFGDIDPRTNPPKDKSIKQER